MMQTAAPSTAHLRELRGLLGLERRALRDALRVALRRGRRARGLALREAHVRRHLRRESDAVI